MGSRLNWDRAHWRKKGLVAGSRISNPKRWMVSVSNLDELERLIFGPDSEAAMAERLDRIKRRRDRADRR